MEALNIEEIAKKATNVVKMSPKGSEADFEKRLKEQQLYVFAQQNINSLSFIYKIFQFVQIFFIVCYTRN